MNFEITIRDILAPRGFHRVRVFNDVMIQLLEWCQSNNVKAHMSFSQEAVFVKFLQLENNDMLDNLKDILDSSPIVYKESNNLIHITDVDTMSYHIGYFDTPNFSKIKKLIQLCRQLNVREMVLRPVSDRPVNEDRFENTKIDFSKNAKPRIITLKMSNINNLRLLAYVNSLLLNRVKLHESYPDFVDIIIYDDNRILWHDTLIAYESYETLLSIPTLLESHYNIIKHSTCLEEAIACAI